MSDPAEVVLGNCWNLFKDPAMPLWWCLNDERKQQWRDLLTEGDPVSMPSGLAAELATIPTYTMKDGHMVQVERHSGIPESVSKPRPVWARHLRRQKLRDEALATTQYPNTRLAVEPVVTLAPPTDEEKHDAILVLRDYYDETTEYGQAMLVEATRIMEEC